MKVRIETNHTSRQYSYNTGVNESCKPFHKHRLERQKSVPSPRTTSKDPYGARGLTQGLNDNHLTT